MKSPSGAGVCYEFVYDKSAKVADLNSGHITYSKQKNLNVPQDLIGRVKSREMRRILKHESAIPKSELATLLLELVD